MVSTGERFVNLTLRQITMGHFINHGGIDRLPALTAALPTS
jgi:hypothetical protein